MRVLPPYRETCTAVFLCAKGVTIVLANLLGWQIDTVGIEHL